ncbi:MAG: efflux RND transporter permease subunit [Ruminococcus sp.]|nr:efflux RND transporter permease subunit [Ruminococcus sp.]
MLSKFSVKKPMTVFVAVIIVIVLGIVSFTRMTPDLMPNLDMPYVVVVTTYPGQSPETVETTVTKPLESSMATLENIKNVTSTSAENYSMLMLEFQDDTNMDSVSVDIQGKIDTIEGAWPEGVGTPILIKINPNIMPVAMAAVNYEGKDRAELSQYLEDKLQNQLEGIDGVASISTMGVLEESENVVINQDKLDALNKKIEKALNDKFGDAEDQLNDAKQTISDNINKAENGADELAKAKDALNEQQEQVSNQLANAAGELNAKQLEILQTKLQLLNQKQTLLTQKGQIQAIYEQLVSLQESYQKLTEQQSSLTESYDFLNTLNENYLSLVEELANYEPNTDDYNRIISELESIDEQLKNFDFTKVELPQRVMDTKDALDKIANSLDKIQTTVSSLGFSMDDVFNDTVPEMKSSIDQIDEGINAIDTAIQQIESGESGISSALNELSSQESAANFQMNSAMSEIIANQSVLTSTIAQLDSAEKEIDTSIEQLQEQKKQAKEAANANNTVTMDNISGILTAQNFSMPAGYITNDENQKYLVRVGDKIKNEEELENLVLFDLGMDGIDPVKVSDVADVFIVDNSNEIYAKINGENGLLISFTKQSNYATAEVSDNINAKFEELSKENEGLTFTSLMNQGDYIYLIVNSVLQNLLYGALLAIIILFLFLRDIKPTIVIACSIPISVIFAIVLMYFSGVTLNMISLSGLAIGVGMLVDNSVVVIENIYRLRSLGVPPIKAAMNGAKQVAGAITASTLTTICVFFPIVFVEGLTRQIFTDMALTIGYSLLASLVVALTLVPAMGQRMFRNTKEKKHRIFDKFISYYEKSLRFTLKHRAIALIIAVVVLFGSIALAFMRGFSFMPEMSSTEIAISAEMPVNSKFEDTTKVADQMNKILEEKFDCFETVGILIGNTSAMIGLSGGEADPSTISAYCVLKPEEEKNSIEITKKMEKEFSALPCEVEVSGGSSMSSMSALMGEGVSIKLYGDDLEKLQSTAKDMADKMESIAGIDETDTGIESTTPEIKITVNKKRAIEKSLTVAQVYQQVAAALTTEKTSAALTNDDSTDIDVVVVNTNDEKTSIDDIRNMKITYTTTEGDEKSVRLSEIADISLTESLNSINHDKQMRYLTITGTIKDGYTTTAVTNDVKNLFNNYELPAGFTIEYSGADATTMEAMGQLMIMMLLGVIMIYLIMVAQFQSLKSPFIVMFTIPLACTGGFLGLLVTGNDVSVVAMLGFVMLFGIIVNNGIVLVDYVNQIRLEGREKREALVEAGKTRMRPILMTALTTVFGLIITALGTGTGTEMIQPLAIVCIGGLLYGTLMTLYIVPVMYDLFNKRELRKVSESDLEEIDD